MAQRLLSLCLSHPLQGLDNMSRLERIVEIVSTMENVIVTSPFIEKGEVTMGSIQVTVESSTLPFHVTIKSPYPLQFHGSETIRFFNEELSSYDHVMKDGLICIHTFHSPKLDEKLTLDFNSLKEWIRKFFINKESESHYEHIIVPVNNNLSFFFTRVAHQFSKGEFGTIKYSKLSAAEINGVASASHVIQQFDVNGKSFKCDWSKQYGELPSETGVFVFVEIPPVTNRKFAIENWREFESILEQKFLGFLHSFQKKSEKKNDFPLLIGYKINDAEIHWQVIVLQTRDLPTYGEKILGSKNYIGRLKDKIINWGQTKNCSYSYFFGRGALNKNLTDANILIIGVGAVGSMVARSLVRGGCRKITLADHDKKEPENVCRSEYDFQTGVTLKVSELSKSLTSISPFVEVNAQQVLMDAAKIFLDHKKHSDALCKLLGEYDIIFDCTTDDDVAYVLERYQVRAQVFNLSITNNAKELICAVSPNLYNWLQVISKKFNYTDHDLYNPTGCWDPTFKASHNDISVLVQFALKQINVSFIKGLPARNFFLSTSQDDGFDIKLNQF
jgi:molybdopterin/thiamine biosynthesis adenylyltransferase